MTHGPLILCADDFGLAPGVNRGIHALATAGRIGAASCMVTAPAWRDAAARLGEIAPACDIGLHLTLTDLAPAGALPRLAPGGTLPQLETLYRLAYLRRLDRAAFAGEIAAEIERQLDRLETALGRPPDYVDGHKHVHLLPGIRHALLGLFARGRLDRRRTYLRSCREPARQCFRRGVAVGSSLATAAMAAPLAKAARAAGIALNDSFRGANDFARTRPFRDLCRRFAAGPGERPLVMCHPGFPDAELAAIDSLVERRQDEFDYLAGPDLPADLDAAGRRIARFPWP
ncbi:MAG: ChbG/HpnK family deacetylase [Rhodospirillaceae bacterium]|nr:ChbG/HpnK family deacetylase [Rhodospirillaceae bacterium]